MTLYFLLGLALGGFVVKIHSRHLEKRLRQHLEYQEMLIKKFLHRSNQASHNFNVNG